MTGSTDQRNVKPRLNARSVKWLLGLTIMIVVVAACEPGGQPDGTTTTSLQTPGRTQQVWCAGQGPGVVLINGIGDQASSRQWLDVQAQLAQHARVCRYDRPGTGDSPPPTQSNRGPGALVVELDAVVDHTTDGEIVLVAHSFGGYLARLYTQRQPERVRGIVFVDALDPSVGLLRGTGVDDLGEVAMANEQLDLHALETAAAAVTEFPADIEVGVLVRERDVTPAWIEGQQQLAALSPRSYVDVVKDTSHQIPTDAPEAVAAAVRRLWGRATGAASVVHDPNRSAHNPKRHRSNSPRASQAARSSRRTTPATTSTCRSLSGLRDEPWGSGTHHPGWSEATRQRATQTRIAAGHRPCSTDAPAIAPTA